MIPEIQVGDVIQVNEDVPEWTGCLLIVDEVKSWGVQAGMRIPNQGTAYLRLKDDQYEYIGQSAFLVADSNED